MLFSQSWPAPLEQTNTTVFCCKTELRATAARRRQCEQRSIFDFHHWHKSTKVGHLFERSDSGGTQHHHLAIMTDLPLPVRGEQKKRSHTQAHNSPRLSVFGAQVCPDNGDLHFDWFTNCHVWAWEGPAVALAPLYSYCSYFPWLCGISHSQLHVFSIICRWSHGLIFLFLFSFLSSLGRCWPFFSRLDSELRRNYKHIIWQNMLYSGLINCSLLLSTLRAH